jgi:tRNA-specific 2-thiouridylase
VRIEPDTRRLMVGPRSALAIAAVRVEGWNWLGEDQTRMGVKVRSLSRPVAARRDGDWLLFDTPELGVAPGQAAVAYDGSRLLGGGWIASTQPAVIDEPLPLVASA